LQAKSALQTEVFNETPCLNLRLSGFASGETQQFAQGGAPGLMESRAQHTINGFQICTAAVTSP
jgi:hypothetical protein